MFIFERIVRGVRLSSYFRQKLPPISTDPIYAKGLEGLSDYLHRRQRGMKNIDKVLPEPDVDLTELATNRIPSDLNWDPNEKSNLAEEKLRILRNEFAGYPELFAVHGLVIAALRRKKHPPRAKRLFFRMWQEHGELLASELPVRWLISSATTFADHGRNANQRLVGQGLSMLFDLIKLHDSERRLSSRENSRPFEFNHDDKRDELAFGMPPYIVSTGDLDIIMLARLRDLSEADPMSKPLARRMLHLVMYDNRTVFARVGQLKRRLRDTSSRK